MDQPTPATPSIRILRPGTFTSVEGKQITFGQAELQAIADGYDADSDPAPLVIGHPKMDDPAWGWVGSLSVEGGELVARPDTIEAGFAERVRKGDYRKVSARLYEPGNPHNPKPGSFYLKHIGFLGAHAPGVKGLGTVQFAEGEEDATVTIDTQPKEEPMSDKTKPAKPTTTTGGDQDASFAEREAELTRREREADERERKQKKAAADARHEANASFAEGLVKDAKLAPAGKDLVTGLLDRLGELDTDATVSFGEGESIKPEAALKKLLSDATPLISFGEQAKPTPHGNGHISFAAPAGYSVPEESQQLHAAAKKLQTANPDLPWMDAVRQAQAGA
ncbi:hypothetical protein MKP08_08315 [Erythrobacter sp. LQ02-29]|uniref:hypothetical protein n=1 Tax=Erythrobacter sp. LQ02-29 TaxID=2920384 RepID=UPI001F4EA095|nr:hypothetical protein [Erythrobacter sp. LQ02-29]MCP9222747.1 hypothetical protein [Erythrobacter sp. LQ02-29]